MELDNLRNFIKVADSGNITKAAEQLHLSQPTLSRQIRSLEDMLGKPLFERSFHKLSLTAEGAIFYTRAKEIVQLVNRSVSEVSNKGSGHLTIASAFGAQPAGFDILIESFMSTCPDITITMQNGTDCEITNILGSKAADIICCAGIQYNTIEKIDTHYHRVLGVLMREGDRQSNNSSISLEDLSKSRLMCPDGVGSNTAAAKLLSVLLPGSICVRYDDPGSVFSWISKDSLYLVGYEYLIKKPGAAGVCFRPIDTLEPDDIFIYRTSSVDNPAADMLMQFLSSFYALDP
ncbi:MAG: LysR family transcriptional regulator [Firmicutes bacterium]|nr:LysR family transcriptional regulator [Bacillota bacterium]